MISNNTRNLLRKVSIMATIDEATDFHRHDIVDSAIGTGIGSIASSVFGTKELLSNLKNKNDRPGKLAIAQAGVKAAPVMVGAFAGSHGGTALGIIANNMLRRKLGKKFDESKHSVLPVLGALIGTYGGVRAGRYFAANRPWEVK